MAKRTAMHSDLGNKSVIQNILSLAGVADRFDNLLISLHRAQSLAGKLKPGTISYEESEQAEARRQLLSIEKIAIKNQTLQELSDASFKDAVSHDFHRLLFSAIRKKSTNLQKMCSQYLGFSTDIKYLLEVLNLQTTTLAKIAQYIEEHSWLGYEIMKTVNLPEHRRRDAKGNSIQVESMRTAISYLGMENLKQIIPYMIFKRSLPQTTDPFPAIKDHLFTFGCSTAVCASLIAPLKKLNGDSAYLLGVFHAMGRSLLIKLYFRLFELTRITLMERMKKAGRSDACNVLATLAPSANYLIALQDEFADPLAADLLSHITPRKFSLSSTMHSMVNESPNSMARVLDWAREYAKVRMLLKHRCIDRKMVKIHLLNRGFPAEAVEILNHASISAPPFNRSPNFN